MLLVLASLILARHTWTLTEARASAVGLTERLTELKSDVSMLKAITETEDYYGAAVRQSREEQASVAVLPDAFDRPNIVHFLDAMPAFAPGDGACTVTSITIADPVTRGDNIDAMDASFSFHCPLDRALRMFSVLRVSGELGVADVLGYDTARLVEIFETSAPVALPSLYQFLQLPLLDAVEQHDKFESQLLRDVPDEAHADVKTMLASSDLARVQELLAPILKTFDVPGAWPIPLLTIKSFDIQSTGGTATITFFARSAKKP
jgi:hypothetical protein